jgi:aspartyl-tRNA(Asn)/glutamyl-tRNA(Gln) amidotransferase subunit C
MQSRKVTSKEVFHIARLAHIPVTEKEAETLAEGFTTTYEVVESLKKANTQGMSQTQQVTGLNNIMREDMVDESRMFSQEEALRNAPRTHNGYFVVDQILDKDAV